MSDYKLITSGIYPPPTNWAFRDAVSHPPHPAFEGWQIGRTYSPIEPPVGSLPALPETMTLRHHMIGNGGRGSGYYLCFSYDNGTKQGGLIGFEPFYLDRKLRQAP